MFPHKFTSITSKVNRCILELQGYIDRLQHTSLFLSAPSLSLPLLSFLLRSLSLSDSYAFRC